MMRITFLYFLFLVLGYAQTELQVEKYTLENGLTVILNPINMLLMLLGE